MPIPKFDNVDWAILSYKSVITQTAGPGAGFLVLTVPSTVYFILSTLEIKASALGAGRTLNIEILDDDDVSIARLARNVSLASANFISLPGGIQATVAAEKEVAWLPGDIMLGSGDKISISLAAMATAETFTTLLRGFIWPPQLLVATTTGSAGTVTKTGEEQKAM